MPAVGNTGCVESGTIDASCWNINIHYFSPSPCEQGEKKRLMSDLFAEEPAVKKMARVKGLSLDAIRRRKAVKKQDSEEEEEGNAP